MKPFDVPFRLAVDGPLDDGVEFVVFIVWNRCYPFVFAVGYKMGPGEYLLFADKRKAEQDAVVADKVEVTVRLLAISRGNEGMIFDKVRRQDA